MTVQPPFTYPSAPHVRTHAPAGYTDYRSYKPWLRDEFAFRCVYCLFRERWYPSGHAAFGADHLLPQSDAPELAASYENLVYACNQCNWERRADPLPVSPLEPLANHLTVRDDGTIRGLTTEGEKLILLCGLDSPGRTREREVKQLLMRTAADHPDDPRVQSLFRNYYSYPDDLPDLSNLRPPGGNARAGGETHCHHARHRRGELPDVY